MSNKMNYRLRNKVWERDHESCQRCGKKLYNVTTIDPFKEILEELHTLKDIEIYKWETNCWKCKKKTPRVSYYLNIGFNFSIGNIEIIDKFLMQKYSFVQKVFSKTMKQEVIANTCVHCGILQGNWFIGEEIILDIIYQGFDKFLDIKIPNNLTLEDLSFDKEDPMFQKYEDIKRFGHVHHIDGDRSNNKLENLLLLCPSCHKKADIERKKNIGKSEIS